MPIDHENSRDTSGRLPAVSSSLRALPSVAKLLRQHELVTLAQEYSPTEVTTAVRGVLEESRTLIKAGNGICPAELTGIRQLTASAVDRVKDLARPTLVPSINATGIVLHTGLGRSRLASSAVRAIANAALSHSLLEIDSETGRRGSRQQHAAGLLRELTGADSAAVLNNCAGAVLLAIAAVAAGKEVILSRGEMVEIGGAFRMPDIIKAAGAVLVEVGTTNRTRVADYSAAITDRTGLILRCHASNFQVVGFTEEAQDAELVALGRKHGIAVMEDQGSGSMIDLAALGLSKRHGCLRHSVDAGFDLITASGDKLLGGTQAGIVLGRANLISMIMRHPLARALRIDKLNLAGLEASLRLYRDPERAIAEIPTLRYLTRSESEIRRAAIRLRAGLRKRLPSEHFEISLTAERSEIGGGSVPGDSLPTTCVAIFPTTSHISVDQIASTFRAANPAVFGRVKNGAFLMDPRTVERHEIDYIISLSPTLMTTNQHSAAQSVKESH